MKTLPSVRAFVFDAYGTIFDLSSATARCAALPVEKREGFTALWREKQLQYTWLRSLQGDYADFERVTRDALNFTLETFDIASPSLRETLMDLFFSLSAFPEVESVITTLRKRGYRTAILSNGTPSMLAAALKSAKLNGIFDEVLSADSVGVFKTHPRVYEHCLTRLGLHAHDIAFQSSNAWDAYAASAFGMRVVWCNRYAQRKEHLPGAPDFEIRTLAELPDLIRD